MQRAAGGDDLGDDGDDCSLQIVTAEPRTAWVFLGMVTIVTIFL
jgi:hypothetical protein